MRTDPSTDESGSIVRFRANALLAELSCRLRWLDGALTRRLAFDRRIRQSRVQLPQSALSCNKFWAKVVHILNASVTRQYAVILVVTVKGYESKLTLPLTTGHGMSALHIRQAV